MDLSSVCVGRNCDGYNIHYWYIKSFMITLFRVKVKLKIYVKIKLKRIKRDLYKERKRFCNAGNYFDLDENEALS